MEMKEKLTKEKVLEEFVKWISQSMHSVLIDRFIAVSKDGLDHDEDVEFVKQVFEDIKRSIKK